MEHRRPRPMTLLAIAWTAVSTLVASSCGSSGSTAPNDTVVTLAMVDNQTGYAWAPPAAGPYAGGVPWNPTVGDGGSLWGPNLGARGLLGFSLASIPTGATVKSATLTLTLCRVSGDPVTKLGSVIVDHVSYAVPVDSSAYNAAALASDIGILAADTISGPKSVDVGASVIADLAASRSNSQYRLRMSQRDFNGDTVEDDMFFGADQANSAACSYVPGAVPKLVVKYAP